MREDMSNRLEIRLADEFYEHAESYADLALALIEREVPEVVADATRRRLGRDGSAALLRECAGALRHELGAVRYHAPAAALAYGRHLAREGVELASILRAYRLGQEVLFARAAELALEDPDPRGQVAALARVAALSFRFVDGAMSDVADEYETQRELFIRGALAQRASVLAALLAGQPVDRHLAERTLSTGSTGAPRDRRLVDRRSRRGRAPTDCRARARRRHRRRAASASQRHARRGHPLDDSPARTWPPGLRALVPPGVRAAIGTPGSGVDGFTATKRQADLSPRRRRCARRRINRQNSGTRTLYGSVNALAAVMLS